MQSPRDRVVRFLPYVQDNLYLNSAKSVLRENADRTSNSLWRLRDYHTASLNWFEKSRGWKDFAKKVALLLALKLYGRKIVWTVHNLQAHENSVRWQERILWILLGNASDRIHILCEATRAIPLLAAHQSKIRCVPHGDYFGCYEPSGIDIGKRHGIAPNRRILLFLGQVRPYKNIELLVQAFSASSLSEKDYTLLICGKTYSNEYRHSIEGLASENPNVVFSPEFVPDSEMGDYLARSCALVVPYNTDSSLNSGTLWMACSYGRTMILPEIGCVQDLPELDFLYTYRYSSAPEHLSQLTAVFSRLASDVDDDPGILESKGQIAKRIMEERSWSRNSKRWIELFTFDPANA